MKFSLALLSLLTVATAVAGAVIGRADSDEVATSLNVTTATRVMVTLVPESPWMRVYTTGEVITEFPASTPAP
ncbi:hypothetical protein Moror_11969 [Moniliophthora roreri MCA 2997]|uniref:Uncharacterized protein n=1 Tax=Moniliophthora roreri (strain MCA 2997) TaxID=1381753 RepID=V2Y5V8_MONRO|nr:hypothetical protein Moror_11969 [Moniliophthora roreri MCA 2997]